MADLMGDIRSIINRGSVIGLAAARDAKIAEIDKEIRALEMKKVEITLAFEDHIKKLRD